MKRTFGMASGERWTLRTPAWRLRQRSLTGAMRDLSNRSNDGGQVRSGSGFRTRTSSNRPIATSCLPSTPTDVRFVMKHFEPRTRMRSMSSTTCHDR